MHFKRSNEGGKNEDMHNPDSFMRPRQEWDYISQALDTLEYTKYNLGLEGTDVVHLGGTALYYYLYSFYGEDARTFFRGTRDLDLITFRTGRGKMLFDALVGTNPDLFVAQERYEVIASHLADKLTFNLETHPNTLPLLKDRMHIDVYEASSGIVHFNDRTFSPKRIVRNPPTSLDLRTKGIGVVGVPTLSDYLIIKLDILSYSKKGLREKDQIDILTLMRLLEDSNVNLFDFFSEALDDLRTYFHVVEFKDFLNRGKMYTLLKAMNYSFLPSEENQKLVVQSINDVTKNLAPEYRERRKLSR